MSKPKKTNIPLESLGHTCKRTKITKDVMRHVSRTLLSSRTCSNCLDPMSLSGKPQGQTRTKQQEPSQKTSQHITANVETSRNPKRSSMINMLRRFRRQGSSLELPRDPRPGVQGQPANRQCPWRSSMLKVWLCS